MWKKTFKLSRSCVFFCLLPTNLKETNKQKKRVTVIDKGFWGECEIKTIIYPKVEFKKKYLAKTFFFLVCPQQRWVKKKNKSSETCSFVVDLLLLAEKQKISGR